MNSYWDNEEFEDLVARGLIAMYETKVDKICKRVPSVLKVTDKELYHLRRILLANVFIILIHMRVLSILIL